MIDVLVIGGGPAGLAAASAARAAKAGAVIVLEREAEAGGVPRHCEHTGFGIRDLHRVLTGPVYARRWTDRAACAGVEIRTSTMVTGWTPEGHARVTGPDGVDTLPARAVILATGARERPRSARLVPGDRPAGVLTTGQLQQLVRAGLPVGERALVVGAEHVSYSAVLTLRHAGLTPVAMVTDLPRSQSFRLFDLATRLALSVPVRTGTRVVAIRGRERVEHVELVDREGRSARIEVDTVVFTGDWIPDHELARRAGLAINPGTLGPVTDPFGATTRPQVWAAGNLVHPVETADVAARRGASVGAAVGDWLRNGDAGAPALGPTPIEVVPPIRWVSPDLVRPDGVQSRLPTLVRCSIWVDRPCLRFEQGGRLLGRYRLRRLVPNRSHHVPATWTGAIRSGAGPVTVELESPV